MYSKEYTNMCYFSKIRDTAKYRTTEWIRGMKTRGLSSEGSAIVISSFGKGQRFAYALFIAS